MSQHRKSAHTPWTTELLDHIFGTVLPLGYVTQQIWLDLGPAVLEEIVYNRAGGWRRQADMEAISAMFPKAWKNKAVEAEASSTMRELAGARCSGIYLYL